MDLFDMFGPSDMTDHLIRFVNHLDPNGPAPMNLRPSSEMLLSTDPTVRWPRYDGRKLMLEYLDGSVPTSISSDTYCEEQVAYVAKFLEKYSML